MKPYLVQLFQHRNKLIRQQIDLAYHFRLSMLKDSLHHNIINEHNKDIRTYTENIASIERNIQHILEGNKH